MLSKGTLISLAALALVVAGCAKPEESTTGTSTTGDTATKQTLTVKGSDTLVQLAQVWAQDFMKVHPEISVTVTGGGSNTGIAALMNKGTDIANASRPMKDEEKEAAKKNGIDVKEFIVAQDALSMIVNKSNPINELTIDQLADIYLGKTTNWKQLGGPDKNIVVNGRESSSGTFTFFQEHVLKKKAYATTVLQNPATTAIVENVTQDDGAIGYVGLGYVNDKVKALKIKKDATSPAVEATVADVLNGTYPLSRSLFEYMPGEPTGPSKVWLDWVMGKDGQALVEKLGFVPVKS
ncbi:phosphate ABC transporter substrate-binding protein [soil metagenome]